MSYNEEERIRREKKKARQMMVRQSLDDQIQARTQLREARQIHEREEVSRMTSLNFEPEDGVRPASAVRARYMGGKVWYEDNYGHKRSEINIIQ